MKQCFKKLQFNVAVLICAFIGIAFVSCKDDNENETVNDSIVGTWLLSIIEQDYEWYCKYEFKSNNTYKGEAWGTWEPYEVFYGTWSVENDILTLSFYEEFVDSDEWYYTESFHFLIVDDSLIIYDYDEPGPNVFEKV